MQKQPAVLSNIFREIYLTKEELNVPIISFVHTFGPYARYVIQFYSYTHWNNFTLKINFFSKITKIKQHTNCATYLITGRIYKVIPALSNFEMISWHESEFIGLYEPPVYYAKRMRAYTKVLTIKCRPFGVKSIKLKSKLT